ncbi:MAG: DUF480 domain-containing protein, partial [Steroidobacteraceae bacterium]
VLLRGPQTPGELRTRASRMAPIEDVGQTESALNELTQREDGPFVARLAREPGRREARYAHLFSGDVDTGPMEAAAAHEHEPAVTGSERITKLEELVAELRRELDELKSRLGS